MSEPQGRYQSTLPAERAIEYSVGTQAVRLTPAMVRQYLVHGRNELVTDQEVIFFMHICRARSLNPCQAIGNRRKTPWQANPH